MKTLISSMLFCAVTFLILQPLSVFAFNSGAVLQQPIDTPPALKQQPQPAQLLQTEATPAVADSDILVNVTEFRFSGKSSLAPQLLQQTVAPWIGKQLTLAQLQQPVAAVTELYRRQGHLLTKAYLPVQAIKNGVVEIAITEATYNRITVSDQVRLKSNATAPLRSLEQGATVDSHSLEQTLLLMRNLPGIDINSTLSPGAEPGTTDLLVDIQPGKTINGDLRADNFGSQHYGRYRLGAGLQLNNPASFGDRLTLRGMRGFSGGQMNFGSINYQFPFGRQGFQLATGLTVMDYKLGAPYKSLQAVGDASIFTADLQYPVILRTKTKLSLNIRYTRKWLSDEYKTTATSNQRQSDAVSFELQGNRLDNLDGSNFFSLLIKHGSLRLNSQATQTDAVSARTAGNFSLLNLSLGRVQQIADNWFLQGNLVLQRASKNLDSAEKMQFGGITAVRAYPAGELSADNGEQLKLDLYYRFSPNLQLGLFYDLGHGEINKNRYSSADNSRTLQAIGATASAMPLQNWYLDGTLAIQVGNEATLSEPDRDIRGWLQLIRTF